MENLEVKSPQLSFGMSHSNGWICTAARPLAINSAFNLLPHPRTDRRAPWNFPTICRYHMFPIYSLQTRSALNTVDMRSLHDHMLESYSIKECRIQTRRALRTMPNSVHLATEQGSQPPHGMLEDTIIRVMCYVTSAFKNPFNHWQLRANSRRPEGSFQ